MLELNGHKYSKTQFEGYKYRAQVKISTSNHTHYLSIYTTDDHSIRVREILWERKSPKAIGLEIVKWTTKEQDDIESEFIDEFLNS